LIYSQKRFIDK